MRNKTDSAKDAAARSQELRIKRAQRLVRRHVTPGTSLVDELIAERREAAKRE